jgi:hypothetical protein
MGRLRPGTGPSPDDLFGDPAEPRGLSHAAEPIAHSRKCLDHAQDQVKERRRRKAGIVLVGGGMPEEVSVVGVHALIFGDALVNPGERA